MASEAVGNTRKADDLVKQAREKLGSFMSLFSDPSEEAMEIFAQAAAQYKNAKAYSLAGDTYKEAAACALKMKSNGEAASHWTNAGQCYKKIPDADRMFFASRCNCVSPQSPRLLVRSPHVPLRACAPETAECFENSISFHIDSNQFAQAAKLNQELAELYVAQNQLEQAVDRYTQANDHFSNANSATYAPCP